MSSGVVVVDEKVMRRRCEGCQMQDDSRYWTTGGDRGGRGKPGGMRRQNDGDVGNADPSGLKELGIEGRGTETRHISKIGEETQSMRLRSGAWVR